MSPRRVTSGQERAVRERQARPETTGTARPQGGAGRPVRRALRTASAFALVLATATGAALSAGPDSSAVRVAVGSSAVPEIPVDPITGAPVPIDGQRQVGALTVAADAPATGKRPTGSATGSTGARSAAAGGAGAAVGTATAAGADAPVALSAAAPGAARLAEAGTGTESDQRPVTVSGTGEFAGLEVTVHQTAHLVNQSVPVTWTGAKPTWPSPMILGRHYLQFMQCWGDEETGPSREQCQYGATKGDARISAGDFVSTRQLNAGALKDRDDPIQQANPTGNIFVPFRPANGGPAENGGASQYYDAQTTNEVPFGPTRADGSGQIDFEMQTGMEAPGLGCGQTPAGAPTDATPRRCWLVIVPRGEIEVDGQVPTGSSGKLQTSPLSFTNWNKRLVVPLSFERVGLSCPIGSSERPTNGSELAAEVMWRWQPVLCRQAGGIFSYTQIADHLARGQLNQDDPGLSYLGLPQARADDRPGRTPYYAPVALSGLTFAFDIESQSGVRTPEDKKKKDGQRIHDIQLTPRLIAKLMTQSYQQSVNPRDPDVPADNPVDLLTDPEFLALNPYFKDLYFPTRVADLLLPNGDSDAAQQVWTWLLKDPEAAAFLQGEKHPEYKDTINKAWLRVGTTYPRSNYPKQDAYCLEFPDDLDGRPAWCNLDSHAYAPTMREGARGISRGDNLGKSVWDATVIPGQLKKGSPQPQGLRAMMALTTTAQAARFGLSTARIRNAKGEFVAPTDSAMLTMALAAKSDDPDLAAVIDPSAQVTGGYPLTFTTFAATVPSQITAEAGKSYADLLRYAAGPGQETGVAAGQLPIGYVPLPEKTRERARLVADAIEANAGKPEPTPSPSASASSSATPSASVSAAASPSGMPAGSSAAPGENPTTPVEPIPPVTGGTGSEPVGSGNGGPPPAGGGAPVDTAPLSPPPPSPTPSHSPVLLSATPSAAPVAKTAGTEVGSARYLLLGALIAGLLAAVGGVAVPRLLRSRRH
ncbi:hypothetical protein ACIRBX_13475 [Kitasatospora sp. NPDC096147]|uniref:hypothetical protein n=1 Tax=Kitasatospora sp. NPDC096147 TaxID=3364093 RepID=UPI0037FF9E55